MQLQLDDELYCSPIAIDPLNLVRLESQRHGPGNLGQHRHIVEFAHHSLHPQPVGDVAAAQVDDQQAAAGVRRRVWLTPSSSARPPNVLSSRGRDSPTTA